MGAAGTHLKYILYRLNAVFFKINYDKFIAFISKISNPRQIRNYYLWITACGILCDTAYGCYVFYCLQLLDEKKNSLLQLYYSYVISMYSILLEN